MSSLEEWQLENLQAVMPVLRAGVSVRSIDKEFPVFGHGKYILKTSCVKQGRFLPNQRKEIIPSDLPRARVVPTAGTIIISRMNTPQLVGECGFVDRDYHHLFLPDRLWVCEPTVNARWLSYALSFGTNARAIKEVATGTSNSMKNISKPALLALEMRIPPAAEQQAIATALSDADAYIESLEQLITKKRQIKQGVMQELLTGKRRLPGFEGRWTTSLMVDLAECLDHLRIPLNDSERSKMRGAYPYCGANGVLDYIDRYCVDDRVVLIAEDGGYFDEYATRPIAYRMSGRFWVNNHAHILKSKDGFNQDFLFYSLVHKNVLNFLASGTRAKLNKSELLKIPIYHPVSTEEQNQISNCLIDIDGEIAALETKVGKVRDLRQAMMQQLLTGKIRLV